MQVAAEQGPLVHAIPIEDIAESPANPRKTFGDLGDLVESVKRQGILQPLLARPKADGYELVFGHRRLRAAREAGLATVPVMVRPLDDTAALEAMIVENAQREDVHPLEEASGFEQLRDVHGYSVDEIAAKVGKSRAFVYARLKLCALSPKAREAFFAGKLSAEVALLIARVPTEELQAKALEDLVPHHADEEPYSVRDARDLMRREYTLHLKVAPFDLDDAELVPAAGSCAACPKRSGNQRELFADVADDDLCTDPSCFREKKEALRGREVAKLEAKGVTVVSSGSAPAYGKPAAPSGFVRLDDWNGNAGKTVGEVLKEAGVRREKAVMLADDGKQIPVVSKKLLDEVLKRARVDVDKKSEKDALERRVDAMRLELAVGAVAAAAERREPNAAFWRTLVGVLASGGDEDLIFVRRGLVKNEQLVDMTTKDLIALTDRMNEKQLRGLAVEMLVDRSSRFTHDTESPFALFCELYKVDPKAFAKDARAAVRAEETKKEIASSTKKGTNAGVRAFGVCRECGCTDEEACEGDCEWVEPDLCSSCVAPAKDRPAVKRAAKTAKKKPKR